MKTVKQQGRYHEDMSESECVHEVYLQSMHTLLWGLSNYECICHVCSCPQDGSKAF